MPPSIAADPSITFCLHVASGSERSCTVISVRRTCLLICLPVSLLACLPARVLPTARLCTCSIHLAPKKRRLSSGHPTPLLAFLLFQLDTEVRISFKNSGLLLRWTWQECTNAYFSCGKLILCLEKALIQNQCSIKDTLFCFLLSNIYFILSCSILLKICLKCY